MPTPLQRRTQAGITPSDDATDAELVRLAQATPRAFTPLYLRYRDPIINYCYYRLGDREESEDAASVIFVKALDHLPRFSPRGDSFRTWLFRIAHNEIVDRYRLRARRPELPLDPDMRLPDSAPAMEEIAIATDRRAAMRRLLAQLPPRERAVVELRTSDLTTAEIAHVLQISEQNVRTAQSRAVSRLRLLLSGAGVAPREAVDA